MIELLLTLILVFILNDLAIFGFYAATDYEEDYDINQNKVIVKEDSKEILWWVRYNAKKYLGEYWCKPIACCPLCMVSLHSAWGWIPIYSVLPFTWWLIYIHAVYILAMGGLNKLILTKFDL